jgi:DhnA family fructose-bisphosphate aldolase class Ia
VTAAAFLAQGAHGLVYGRNIYQHPIPGLVAVMAMIHERASAERTLSIYGGKA